MIKKITVYKAVILGLATALSLVSGVPALAKQDATPNEPQEKNAKVCIKDARKLDEQAAVCHARVIVDAKGNPKVAPQPAGLSPVQLRSAYNVSGVNLPIGSNRVIAIVDAYDHPNAFSDLTTYSQTFNIQPQISQCAASTGTAAAPCFQKVNQRGTAQPPQADPGWALEISLDIQAARAMCPGCSILLVEADSSSYGNLMTAVDQAVTMGAKIISNSYGSNEFASEAANDSHFNKPGVAFTVSSGDAGYGVEYPASSPYVTAVGGTSLTMNNLTRVSETAWSGAGSGCSGYEPLTSSQTADATCSKRKVSDVSAVADPSTGAAVYDSFRYQGRAGWFKVGGTSLAAPVIAGVYALAGASTYSSIPANSLPYLNTASLNDILTGSNGSCGSTYLCTAKPGYDGPTGLGTPKGLGGF
ncbi:MAG TPA: S53 family peptidase [Patescibacteria group bacterium]|jgi:subtilase family serine protease|nr:S53 family peptidase [Patescibacteria group bacterium]